jgi:hypothetical protein
LHEQGATIVPTALAQRLSMCVDIEAGMRITEALTRVLQAQEQFLVSSKHFRPGTHALAVQRQGDHALAITAPRRQEGDSSSQWLDASAARELTDRIKASANQLWILLLEAHERRAWIALGYASWAAYVRAEFRISRSRSYQLIDQGRVIRALRSVSTSVDISEAQARDLKPRLVEVTETVRSRLAAGAAENVAYAVEQVVKEERQRGVSHRLATRGAARRDVHLEPGFDGACSTDELSHIGHGVTSGEAESLHSRTATLSALDDAVRALANMPPVPDILSQILTHHQSLVDHLASALRWLTELNEAWSENGPPPDNVQSGASGNDEQDLWEREPSRSAATVLHE